MYLSQHNAKICKPSDYVTLNRLAQYRLKVNCFTISNLQTVLSQKHKKQENQNYYWHKIQKIWFKLEYCCPAVKSSVSTLISYEQGKYIHYTQQQKYRVVVLDIGLHLEHCHAVE